MKEKIKNYTNDLGLHSDFFKHSLFQNLLRINDNGFFRDG